MTTLVEEQAPAAQLDPGALDGEPDWADEEAYRELFVSVIQLAIKDYEFLQRVRHQAHLSSSERKKLRGLTEDGDPEEFFASRWFEDICGMIGVHPDAIREKLETMAAA